MSSVKSVALWLAREMETYPKRELSRSGWSGGEALDLIAV